MKATLLLLCLACIISSASAQSPMLVIILNDGTDQRISVDDIQSLKFTPLALPDYTAMRIEPHRMTDVENDHVYPREIDSITFGLSSLGNWQMQFAATPGPDFASYDPATISTKSGRARLDSVQFFHYRKNLGLLKERPGTSHYSDFPIGTAWESKSLLATRPLRRIAVDDQFNFGDEDTFSEKQTTTLSLNSDSESVVTIEPVTSGYMAGRVIEVDLNTLALTRIMQDSDVTNVVYVPNTRDFIFHRALIDYRGAPIKAQWLYRFSRANETKELILADTAKDIVRPSLGVFDIRPDAAKLLLPYYDSLRAKYGVYEYDLSAKTSDTIALQFLKSITSLKYSHDGKRVLYSLAPSWPDRFNEFGIITIASGEKQILDAAPDNEYAWESIPSAWSLDDKAISLSIANLSYPFGPSYFLYILPLK